MRFINRKTLALAGAAAALIAVGSTGTAVAGSLIDSRQIADGSIRVKDLTPRAVTKFTAQTGGVDGVDGTNGKDGVNGKDGKDGVNGKDGKDGVSGLYYATAFYNEGNTNEGAIASVACKSVTDHALSGGVQVLGLDADANSRNTPVSSSFPGRMDWATNTPKANRTDGWIVQFGGNAGPVADKAPEKVKVWALCMTSDQTLPIVQTFAQVS